MGCSFSGAAPNRKELKSAHGEVLKGMHKAIINSRNSSQKTKRIRAYEALRHAIANNRVLSNNNIRCYYGSHRNYYWHLIIINKQSNPLKWTWLTATNPFGEEKKNDMIKLEQKEDFIWKLLAADKSKPCIINYDRAISILEGDIDQLQQRWNESGKSLNIFFNTNNNNSNNNPSNNNNKSIQENKQNV